MKPRNRVALIALGVTAASAALAALVHLSFGLLVLRIAVGPSGRELPPGQGTAAQGKLVYASQCERCHGATAREGPEAPLVGGGGSLKTAKPLKTIGSYWPYATTLWDYVNRAMPFDRPSVMSANDVYAVTAYLLNLNGIIKDTDVLDAKTLPAIKMPNRDGFVPDPRPDVGKPAKKK